MTETSFATEFSVSDSFATSSSELSLSHPKFISKPNSSSVFSSCDNESTSISSATGAASHKSQKSNIKSFQD
ncbi:hypothetical protein IJL65_04570 [bacterium]|nr:hypothetical protein [bacterium]